jgi:hypothetical protein
LKILSSVKSTLRRSAFAIVALALIPSMLMTACDQNTLATLATTLGTSAANIAKLEGNTALATKLTADTAAASSAIANWQTGTPATEVIEALNLVEDDLNLIPGTSDYAPLADFAIATTESILALLPQPAPTPATAASLSAHAVFYPAASMASLPKTSSQYKKQWNAIVAANPKLAAAKLK